MKKILTLILVMMFTVILLAACAQEAAPPAATPPPDQGAGSAPAQEPEVTTPTPEVDRIDIEFWHYWTGDIGYHADELVAEFNETAGGRVNVTAQWLPRTELLTRYALGVVSGELPEIGMVDNPDSASFSAMGMWLDISSHVESLPITNWIEGALNSGRFNGQQHTIPVRSNCLALWSNDEMLAAAGVDRPPQTWAELLEASAMIREALPDVIPFAFSAIRTEEGTFQFLPLLLSTGADWDTMDSPGAISSLQLLRDLLDNGFTSPEVINWVQADVQMQFSAENVAMMINGTWQIPNVYRDSPHISYTISNIPRDVMFATSLGGENLGLTTTARGIEDYVWDFVEWFMRDENLLVFNQRHGTLAPNLDLTVEMHFGNDPVWQGFQEQIVYARPRGPHPNWPEISSAIQIAMQEVLTGASTPEQAGADAAASIAGLG